MWFFMATKRIVNGNNNNNGSIQVLHLITSQQSQQVLEGFPYSLPFISYPPSCQIQLQELKASFLISVEVTFLIITDLTSTVEDCAFGSTV